ncbi:hypothetical protein ACEPAH_4917 [Sanghuangporus vaninii]
MNFNLNPALAPYFINPTSHQYLVASASPDLHRTLDEIKRFIVSLESRITSQAVLQSQSSQWNLNLARVPGVQADINRHVPMQLRNPAHDARYSNTVPAGPQRTRTVNRNANPCPSCQMRKKKANRLVATRSPNRQIYASVAKIWVEALVLHLRFALRIRVATQINRLDDLESEECKVRSRYDHPSQEVRGNSFGAKKRFKILKQNSQFSAASHIDVQGCASEHNQANMKREWEIGGRTLTTF